MTRLAALSVHTPVLSLQGPFQLRATFARSWHLQAGDGQIVTVTTAPFNGPLTIRVPRLPAVSSEAAVSREPGGLRVGTAHLVLTSSAAWEPAAPVRSLGGEALRRGLVQLEVRQRLTGRGGLTASGSTVPGGDEAVAGLEAALLGDEPGRMQAAMLRLLGLGPGLTPSGDDVLCGLLASWRILPARLGIPAPEVQLPADFRGRTTALSATLLAWAARGVVLEPLLDVLWNLGDEQERLEALLGIGHSSGSDMLTGVILAARALGRRRYGTALVGAPEDLR